MIDGCYLEAKGRPRDHADTIQVYAEGDNVNVTVKDSTIAAHPVAADNCDGMFTFENVVFNGGPFGLRMNRDGKPSWSRSRTSSLSVPSPTTPSCFTKWSGTDRDRAVGERLLGHDQRKRLADPRQGYSAAKGFGSTNTL